MCSLLLACAGSATQEKIPEPPEPSTRATLSGPLCKAERCQCKTEDDEAGLPDPEFKRFEIKLGPSSNELWAQVDDMVFFKTNERATECFYVDLRPGEHAVKLRARGPNGFGAQIAISEQGAAGPYWYDTFLFSCGAPGLCDRDSIERWRKEVEPKGQKHDKCGSTLIQGLTWITGRMPDNMHPADLLLELNLKIYKFIPDYAPGAEECEEK
jgi:hypothetical protein